MVVYSIVLEDDLDFLAMTRCREEDAPLTLVENSIQKSHVSTSICDSRIYLYLYLDGRITRMLAKECANMFIIIFRGADMMVFPQCTKGCVVTSLSSMVG